MSKACTAVVKATHISVGYYSDVNFSVYKQMILSPVATTEKSSLIVG